MDPSNFLDNNWESVCKEDKWLSEWLYSIGDAHSPQGELNGLVEMCPDETDQHPTWITYSAAIFSAITIFCIVIIAVLIVQESRRRNPTIFSIGKANIDRVSSDRVRLISDSLSFPNPVNVPEKEVPDAASAPQVKLAGSILKSGSGSRKKVHFNDT